MEELYMLSFLSAIATTTVVKTVRIEASSADANTLARVWKWLAFAFFSKASQSSVTTLELSRFQMSTALLTTATEIARARDPLVQLYKAMLNKNDNQNIVSKSRPYVQVASNASIRAYGFSSFVLNVQSSFTYTAMVIHDDPSATAVDILIPGFGFCQVERAQTTPADAPIATPFRVRPLETFVLGNMPDARVRRMAASLTTKGFVAPLLQLVGPNITGLALEAEDLDATNVRDIARLCPKVQSLRLRGFSLRSMDAITRLFDQPTFHVSSLDLRDIKDMSTASLETFLERLGERGPDRLVQTLHRLRVGRGWSDTFRSSTDDLMEPMLCGNHSLTHFHLYGRPQNLNMGWDLEDYGFGGELVKRVPLPPPTRMGLLSVLRHTKAGAQLSPELVRHIFSFGAATWRRVHFTTDREGAAAELAALYEGMFVR